MSYQELLLNSCDIETLADKYLVVRFCHTALFGVKSGADKLPTYDAEALQKMHHPGRKDKKDDCLNIQKMSIKYSAGRVQRISGVKKK